MLEAGVLGEASPQPRGLPLATPYHLAPGTASFPFIPLHCTHLQVFVGILFAPSPVAQQFLVLGGHSVNLSCVNK